jgi:hypothetical protein
MFMKKPIAMTLAVLIASQSVFAVDRTAGVADSAISQGKKEEVKVSNYLKTLDQQLATLESTVATRYTKRERLNAIAQLADGVGITALLSIQTFTQSNHFKIAGGTAWVGALAIFVGTVSNYLTTQQDNAAQTSAINAADKALAELEKLDMKNFDEKTRQELNKVKEDLQTVRKGDKEALVGSLVAITGFMSAQVFGPMLTWNIRDLKGGNYNSSAQLGALSLAVTGLLRIVITSRLNASATILKRVRAARLQVQAGINELN